MSFETKVFRNKLNKFEVGDIVECITPGLSVNRYVITSVFADDYIYSLINISSGMLSIAGEEKLIGTSLKRRVMLEKYDLFKYF